jgi:hypothetical protein
MHLSLSVNHVIQIPASTRGHQHNARQETYRNNQGILYDINPNCSIAKIIVEYMLDESLAPMCRSVRNLKLSTNKLGPGIGREGLGALDGGTDGTVDDELGKDTKSTRNTEQNSVEVLLSETVVLEEDTGVLKSVMLAECACDFKLGDELTASTLG